MCLNRNASLKRYLKTILEAEKKFIFNILTKNDNEFSKCYICNKSLNENNVNIINIRSEQKTLCLCSKCLKKFRKNSKVVEKIIFKMNEPNTNEDIQQALMDNVIQINYANMIWLDNQRRTSGRKGNSNKG